MLAHHTVGNNDGLSAKQFTTEDPRTPHMIYIYIYIYLIIERTVKI